MQIEADAVNPYGAAVRDSQAMIDGAAPGDIDAARWAAGTIRQAAKGGWYEI